MRTPLPPCLQPFKSSECISHTWTPHRQLSQTAPANNCAKPQPYAKTCSYWHIMSSMVGLQLRNICTQQLQAFWQFREELSVAHGILLKASRAIVPFPLQPSILSKIHQSHRGPEYCIRFARDAVFWPSMSKDIEEFCYTCPTCTQYGKQAATEPMLSHPTPTLPWQFVSQDIFEYQHKHYLVTVDHCIDFYELDQLDNTLSTPSLISPRVTSHDTAYLCVALQTTDPSLYLMSTRRYAQTFGFEHVTSSPYWSRSNGKAEAAVNDAQSLLKKSQDVYLALLNIRNTPPRGHSFSPVQRLMGRRTRSTGATLRRLAST